MKFLLSVLASLVLFELGSGSKLEPPAAPKVMKRKHFTGDRIPMDLDEINKFLIRKVAEVISQTSHTSVRPEPPKSPVHPRRRPPVVLKQIVPIAIEPEDAPVPKEVIMKSPTAGPTSSTAGSTIGSALVSEANGFTKRPPRYAGLVWHRAYDNLCKRLQETLTSLLQKNSDQNPANDVGVSRSLKVVHLVLDKYWEINAAGGDNAEITSNILSNQDLLVSYIGDMVQWGSLMADPVSEWRDNLRGPDLLNLATTSGIPQVRDQAIVTLFIVVSGMMRLGPMEHRDEFLKSTGVSEFISHSFAEISRALLQYHASYFKSPQLWTKDYQMAESLRLLSFADGRHTLPSLFNSDDTSPELKRMVIQQRNIARKWMLLFDGELSDIDLGAFRIDIMHAGDDLSVFIDKALESIRNAPLAKLGNGFLQATDFDQNICAPPHVPNSCVKKLFKMLGQHFTKGDKPLLQKQALRGVSNYYNFRSLHQDGVTEDQKLEEIMACRLFGKVVGLSILNNYPMGIRLSNQVWDNLILAVRELKELPPFEDGFESILNVGLWADQGFMAAQDFNALLEGDEHE